jgi:hypothetical protein
MAGYNIKVTPLGAILRGFVAGAVGTAAMDLVWWPARSRVRSLHSASHLAPPSGLLDTSSCRGLASTNRCGSTIPRRWKDLSAHLAYGTGTAATFAFLTRD